jgi:predicted RNA-binding Zn-ribbon protein involved in translation (DUF1610 family)
MVDWFQEQFIHLPERSMQTYCSQCGSAVVITAGTYHCPKCGESLSLQAASRSKAEFFYQAAADHYLQGNLPSALLQIQKGLAVEDGSEFHLLAAIIYQQQGQYDQMRRHVAAIPIEDPLRPEGEWLLRSHQERQRSAREGQRLNSVGSQHRAVARQLTAGNPYATRRIPDRGTPERKRRPLRWLAWATMAILLAALIWWRGPALILRDGVHLVGQVQDLIGALGSSFQGSPEPAVQGSSDGLASGASGETEQPLPEDPMAVTTSTVAPATPVVSPSPVDGALPLVPTPADQATNTPTSVENTASVPATSTEDPPPPPTVDVAGIMQIVQEVQNSGFDLAAYLVEAGYTDLADLDVRARLQDGLLVMEGTVASADERTRLIAAAETVPDVDQVEATGLELVLPEFYVTGSGDTLWAIAFRFYGDGSRWQELYTANRDVLPDPRAIPADVRLLLPEP